MDINLSDEQIERYARHIVLAEVGGIGQSKLLQARVLLIGAGGLGSPSALYLAAAGVGHIGIVDDDVVSLSNLQRQILHDQDGLDQAKTDSAIARLGKINPDARVIGHQTRLNAENVMELIADYDIIADGSDNFETRYLVNDACYFAQKTLVSAAVLRFDGQLATFKSHAGKNHAGQDYPCYRCIFPHPPPPDLVPSCAEGGVLGAVVGVMGSLQATEVIKEILDIGESMAGRLLLYDGLAASFRTLRVKANPACPLCGDQPSILTVRSE